MKDIILGFIVMLCVTPGFAGAENIPSDAIMLVAQGQPAAEIMISNSCGEVIRHAAQTLQKEIQRRTGAQLPITTSPSSSDQTIIHLGTLNQDAELNAALAGLGQNPVLPDKPGKEGFRLLTGRIHVAGTVVINGCDDLGAYHGVGWFLRRINFSVNSAAAASDLDLAAAPVTIMRRIRFGDHHGYVNTELAGWRKILSDYILWGLSAATFRCDPAHQGDPRVTPFAQYLWQKWVDRVPLAKSLGLEVMHLTQTNLTFKDGEFGPANVPDFKEINFGCPDFNGVNPKFPRGRDLLYRSRKWFFDHMPAIDQVDYFLTSGSDGGGCLDPELSPWMLYYARLVDEMIYPLLAARNPQARIILGLYNNNGLDITAIGQALTAGWNPSWLYALEFSDNEGAFADIEGSQKRRNTSQAHLFPAKYKRFYFSLLPTTHKIDDFPWYQRHGANPIPHRVAEDLANTRRDGVTDGLGCYSEGTHDFINQIILMQLAWDPDRSVDELVAELCRYYFGQQAAPLVQKVINAMERGDEYQNLLQQAETLLPPWARSSRQWALLVGRAGVDRCRQRTADLMAEWERHWQCYQNLITADPFKHDNPQTVETTKFFHDVLANAQDLDGVYAQLNLRGYGVQGGGQLVHWCDPRAGEAQEALSALEKLSAGRIDAPTGRWCVATLSPDNEVVLADGWGNYLAGGAKASDARMVIANFNGESNSVVFRGDDGALHDWSPLRGGHIWASGDFLTGPLAAKDVDGDGKAEVLVLVGPTAEQGRLAMISSNRQNLLDIHPCGLAPAESLPAVTLNPPLCSRTVNIPYDPQVLLTDTDGDGVAEIICGQRDDDNRLGIFALDGRRLARGPIAPGGAVASGDLDGDHHPEIVYLDENGRLAVYAPSTGKILPCVQPVPPKYPASVVIARLADQAEPAILYMDNEGFLSRVGLVQPAQRLSTLPSAVAAGPGLVAGDFNGDGDEEVFYLRRRLLFMYPLITLSRVAAEDKLRDLQPNMADIPAPLGPRAAGVIRFR